MNFEFSAEEQAFLKEVDEFLCKNYSPEVMDPARENFAQLVDTPARRAFMRKIAERGWLGMTWPKEDGGGEREGVYEYLLNERLAGVGAPQIGKGVGIIGKTLIAHGSDKLKISCGWALNKLVDMLKCLLHGDGIYRNIKVPHSLFRDHLV